MIEPSDPTQSAAPGDSPSNEPQPLAEVQAPPIPVAPPPIVARLSFAGDGVEYFKIWIVNVLLTVVTIGIYSPWAKVRRLQYFYRNTRLADASFDYHGNPIAILKGRLIAAALFFAYSAAGALSPVLALVAFGGIALVMPWFISRSLRFRMHNSSYRGLRFRFDGSTRSAYWVFLGLPILMVLSLFTLFPFWQQRMKRYQYANTLYGEARATVTAPVNEFYVTYVAASAIMIGVFVAAAVWIGAGAGMVAASAGPVAPGDDLPPEAAGFMAVALAGAGITYLLGITATQAFVTARLRNLVWSGLTIGSYRCTSTMRTWPFVRILVTNLLGMVVTLGLFWPFAQVRLTRYLASTLSIEGPADFAEFHSGSSPEEQAVGEEVSEFFDFDIGF